MPFGPSDGTQRRLRLMPELRAMPETRGVAGWVGGRNSGKQKKEEAISRRRTKEKGERVRKLPLASKDRATPGTRRVMRFSIARLKSQRRDATRCAASVCRSNRRWSLFLKFWKKSSTDDGERIAAARGEGRGYLIANECGLHNEEPGLNLARLFLFTLLSGNFNPKL